VKTFLKFLVDHAASAALCVVTPLLLFIVRYKNSLPTVQRLSDFTGVQIRGTHYYEPTYTERDLPADTTGERNLPGVDLNEAEQLSFIADFVYADELRDLSNERGANGSFTHLNNMYSIGDAEIYYSIIRRNKPRKIIEIGSGNSTLIAKLAIEKNMSEDDKYTCEQICIEPYEMPWLEGTGVTVIREKVETVSLEMFDVLQENDILFIDSSHVIRPYGDVLREFNEIIPRVASGVYVQVHDIFTPFDYPEHWLRRERRLWNEQYLLEAFLAFNNRFRIVCASGWLRARHWNSFSAGLPMVAKTPGHIPGAFWIVAN
jgi:hypothetical protein